MEDGPIDLAVLGLGRDGHVAFDEPPARVASGVRIVRLAATTREDAAEGFGGIDSVPDRALTIVCRVGGRSAQATSWLVQQGYDAFNLDGGMFAWASAGRDVVCDGDASPVVL